MLLFNRPGTGAHSLRGGRSGDARSHGGRASAEFAAIGGFTRFAHSINSDSRAGGDTGTANGPSTRRPGRSGFGDSPSGGGIAAGDDKSPGSCPYAERRDPAEQRVALPRRDRGQRACSAWPNAINASGADGPPWRLAAV